MELKFYEKPCPICFGNGFLIQGENKVECYRCLGTCKILRRKDRRTKTGYEIIRGLND